MLVWLLVWLPLMLLVEAMVVPVVAMVLMVPVLVVVARWQWFLYSAWWCRHRLRSHAAICALSPGFMWGLFVMKPILCLCFLCSVICSLSSDSWLER